jgi:hypothetical protein
VDSPEFATAGAAWLDATAPSDSGDRNAAPGGRLLSASKEPLGNTP